MKKILKYTRLLLGRFFKSNKKSGIDDKDTYQNDYYEIHKKLNISEVIALENWQIVDQFIFSVHIVSFFKSLYKNYNFNQDTTKALAIILGKMLEEAGENTFDIELKNADSIDAILTTTFNTSTGELDFENSKVVEFKRLDKDSIESFNGKPLLVLK